MKTNLTAYCLVLLRKAAWLPISIFLIHACASLLFDAYASYPLLDIPMHIMGGVVIAYFFHTAVVLLPEHNLHFALSKWMSVILVMALTATATVFWEFAEFISDRYFGTHAQVSLDDTLLDMLLGLLGGATCLLLIARR